VALKILIIDDNPQDRFLYRRLLSKTDHAFEFIECETGEEGFRSYYDSNPDCVLLDYRLPDIDGMEFLGRLNGVSTDLNAIVVLTSKGSESLAVRALHSGAQDYLTKDVLSPQDLYRAITNAIEKVTLRRELHARSESLSKANAELQAIRENLEIQVEQRTAELRRANAQEQEMRRRAEEANRMKDEFLALLSHELRTPLTAILGWMTALQTGRLDPQRQKTAMDAIHRNAVAQARLIEDLLDVSTIITGKFVVTSQHVNLNEIIKSAIDAMRPQSELKGVEIVLESSPAPLSLVGDGARLRQAILNVLSNAVKFTPEGGRVTVRVGSENQKARIQVLDTGIGIRPAFLPYVFERFRQADASVTRRYGGLGLGLAIVRHIIEIHGGTASVYSAGAGSGTLITLELPLAAASTAIESEKAS
jgi:signal transduction histidine kinase